MRDSTIMRMAISEAKNPALLHAVQAYLGYGTVTAVEMAQQLQMVSIASITAFADLLLGAEVTLAGGALGPDLVLGETHTGPSGKRLPRGM